MNSLLLLKLFPQLQTSLHSLPSLHSPPYTPFLLSLLSPHCINSCLHYLSFIPSLDSNPSTPLHRLVSRQSPPFTHTLNSLTFPSLHSLHSTVIFSLPSLRPFHQLLEPLPSAPLPSAPFTPFLNSPSPTHSSISYPEHPRPFHIILRPLLSFYSLSQLPFLKCTPLHPLHASHHPMHSLNHLHRSPIPLPPSLFVNSPPSRPPPSTPYTELPTLNSLHWTLCTELSTLNSLH